MFHDILETIGNTPIVRLNKVAPVGAASIFAKLESFNPMSSVKDRVAKGMIDDAERKGRVKQGTVIVEPTSGNTGVGLAMVCAVKGYRLILTMPDTMSVERRMLLSALGAEIVLTKGSEGMLGAVREAERIASEISDSFMPQQFENRANPMTHRKTTAKEILRALPEVDAFVAGVGTGGTITGVGQALKKKRPSIRVVAVEPEESPVLSGGPAGAHGIQGIGAGFIPKILDQKIVDDIVRVTTADAKTACRELARKEGILAGISSGAAVHAAIQIAKEMGDSKSVVVLLPDTGERYLSTDLFGE